jgi:hypothetical protein
VIATGCAFVAAVCLADANVEQKTQFHMGGAVGGLVNAFGGKATHEGITSTTLVKGNRKATVTSSNEELVDLDAEKVYHLDLDRKTYRVVTFDELRQQFEDAKKRSAKEEKRTKEKSEGPEYEVEVDVKNTGQKQTINGFDTHEVVTTVTVHEKGKSLEKAGGGVFTADMWIGPRMKEMREIGDFERRFIQKVYGKEFSGADMQQVAVLMATNPAFGKAMKAFADKQSSFDGTAIRTILMFEGVSGSEQKAEADDSGTPTSAGAALGGLLKRAAQRRQQNEGGAQRSKVFESTVELLRATASVAASDVAIPPGFAQK